MKIAAAYIRVSTDDQVEYSPASQLEKIQEFAKRNNYILPQEFIFIDEGISGRNTKKRVAFNRMIGIAKQTPKPFDAILLWKFSRFARNREDSIVYKSMLRKQCGIDVISISENVGDDKMSVLIEALIEAMDEYYSINLGEEVKRGMAEKVSRGEAVTAPSFGYDIQNGVYIPNENTAPILRNIFQSFLNGVGMRQIATNLNENGYRTRRGNLFENRTIQYILNNPVYIGKIRWTPTGKAGRSFNTENTIIIDGHHQPLIDMDTWLKTQDKLKAMPKSKYMRQDSAKTPFMLQGLVRCSACGATLCQAVNHTSLQCHAYAHGKCNISHSITIKKINSMILDAIENAAMTGNFKFDPTPQKVNSKNDTLKLSLEKEKKKLERIKEAYENGVYTLDEFKQSRQQIMSNITEIENRLTENDTENDEKTRQKLKERILSILPSLRSPAVSEEIKNSLIKSFIHRIVFHRSSCSIDIFFYM